MTEPARSNVAKKLRITIYVLNVLGTPFIAYALAKGWIGELEVQLWAAEVTAMAAMAGLNVVRSS